MQSNLTINETFLFDRQVGGEIKVLNCFPNKYEVGMASLGFQTVFKTFASNPKTHTTRYFLDFNEPHDKDIDLITFSISWELDFINVIKILKKLNIPLKSNERNSNHPIIMAGGPSVTANPEPWADFFDIIAIGDCEDNIDQIIDQLDCFASLAMTKAHDDKSLQDKAEAIHSRASRISKLENFLNVPGLYIPELFDADLQFKIERQKTNANNLSSTSVIAPDSCWGDTFLIEVARSCPEMCRFCLASYLTLPFRTPDLASDLIVKAKEAIKHTNNIGLLGPSVTQHPEFINLLRFFAKVKKEEKPDLKIQVSSMRASTVTKEMTDLLKTLNVDSLTIAIESGSQRMRDIINKKLPEEYIFSAAKNARESGLKAIKLYGMVGLPHETDEDIDATIDLLSGLKAENKQLKITWGCSIFTPKAQTPFQNYGVDKDAEKKLTKLTKALKPQGIDVRPESFKWAQVQALISRGDREINDLMIRVEETGQTGFGVYKKLIDKTSYNHFVFDNWDRQIEEGLYNHPWQVLVTDKQKEILENHKNEAMSLV